MGPDWVQFTIIWWVSLLCSVGKAGVFVIILQGAILTTMIATRSKLNLCKCVPVLEILHGHLSAVMVYVFDSEIVCALIHMVSAIVSMTDLSPPPLFLLPTVTPSFSSPLSHPLPPPHCHTLSHFPTITLSPTVDAI